MRNTATKIKTVRFEEALLSQLERAARASGMSQSELVRTAVAHRCAQVLGASLAERLAPVLGRIHSNGGRARDTGAAMRRILAAKRDR
jgi:hypothetical protein